MNSSHARSTDNAIPPSDDILSSWKSIADYLHRDVRTVMRWENARALPVRRVPGGARAAIYALKSELDGWLRRETGRIRADSGEAHKPASSIAILPFVNLSADKENQYFADGLSDEIMNLLTRIPDLRVTARTSSFLFRNTSLDARELGARLGVGTLLEGSIQKHGNRVRVSVQLVETRNGYHLWSDRFDRRFNDAFALQEEIAGKVADALRVKFAPETFVARTVSCSPEAYRLWLKGRSFQYGRRNIEALSRARECFERAIVLDPEFAPAHLGLAEHYREISFLGLVRPSEAAAIGRRSAHRAVMLDEGSGEAHALLGVFIGVFEHDWKAAERGFKRALELNPASAQVRSRYAMFFLVPVMRLDEAHAEMEKVLALDPLSADLHCQMAQVLMFQRTYAEAEGRVQTTLELDAGFFFAYWLRGAIQFMQQRYSEAMASMESAIRIFGRAPVALAAKAAASALSGRSREARRLVSELEDAAQSSYISPVSLAWLNMFLGRTDAAFAWLDRAIEERDLQIIHLACKPLYDGLRTDPRFSALLKRLRLPEEAASGRFLPEASCGEAPPGRRP